MDASEISASLSAEVNDAMSEFGSVVKNQADQDTYKVASERLKRALQRHREYTMRGVVPDDLASAKTFNAGMRS